MAEAVVNWRQLGRLTASQWLVLLQSPFVLGAAGMRLRFSGYRATLEWARRGAAPGIPAPQQLPLARQTAYALAVAVKYGPWRPKCLLRSLALARLLARRGIPFELRIGVPAGQDAAQGADPADFEAHAWVEHNGIVLNDRHDISDEYTPV